jgi:hypothetical protein
LNEFSLVVLGVERVELDEDDEIRNDGSNHSTEHRIADLEELASRELKIVGRVEGCCHFLDLFGEEVFGAVGSELHEGSGEGF